MKKEYCIGLLFSIGYLFILIGTLSDYGMTWDEPENFITGEIYLKFFQTIEKSYLQFNKDNPLFYDKPELLQLYSEKIELPYPPFVNILSAVGYSLLNKDIVFGHHLIIPVFAAFLLFLTFIFTTRHFGLRAAILSSIILGLMPHFFGHAHNNIKDIPLATMYFLAFYFMYKTYLNLNWKNTILAGVTFGLALLTKVNAIFLLFSFGLFVWVIHGKSVASCFTQQQKGIIKKASLLTIILARGYGKNLLGRL